MVEISKSKRSKFLWVEDKTRQREAYVAQLQVKSVDVLAASTMKQALELLEEHNQEVRCAVVEVGIPVNDQPEVSSALAIITRGGERTGLVLGQMIRSKYPDIKVIGYSGGSDSMVIDWFQIEGDGYLVRNSEIYPEIALEVVEKMLQGNRRDRYRPFIVHGHDEDAIKALVEYIQDTLKMAKPVILKDEPSNVSSIFQKLEQHARLRSLAFILLTPDDIAYSIGEHLQPAYRARQNVIFELGYFLGKRQGEQHRLIVLKKGDLELPSDIQELICIDITGGIQAADAQIQGELKAMGILP